MTLLKLAITSLLPVAIATTTILTPQDRGFTVGSGEQQITDYLVASYVPTVEPITVNDSVEEEVIHEFGLNSPMYRIAQCESRFRQFDASGGILRGIENPLDRGVYQINEKYWLEESIKQNYDIFTITGNIQMARYILRTQGLNAWSASKFCWNKSQDNLY